MSISTALAWIGVVIAVGVVGLVVVFVYLGVVLSWEEQRTRGLGYYGLPAEDRDRFRRVLRRHARLLHPLLLLMSRMTKPSLARAGFVFEGVAGPKGNCSPESFERGHRYEPSPEDVFVVTQMKCGTTWMQHVVYEVLCRGAGDLVETGRTLYAISPWLEGLRSVSVEEAPLVGEEKPSRIIKTHFPVELCPFDESARYVYVARHPVSCFASCTDFLAANLGPFAPDLEAMQEWFCDDDSMWWGSWPRHVDGWWSLAERRDNVLFVRFEEMKRDLPGVIVRVAEFLGVCPLTEAELREVDRKCGFGYMSEHSGSFEMHPPHVLASDAELFVKGTSDRYRDIPPEVRSSVMDWCRDALEDRAFPMNREYPST